MNSIARTLINLKLIPSDLEFTEFKIDHYIDWLTKDDPNSSLTTKEMVELDAQIAYFQQRRQELAQECDRLLVERCDQFNQASIELQHKKPPVIRIGTPHQVEAREQHWFETQLERLETACNRELSVIRGRYVALIQECDHCLDRVQTRLTEIQQHQLNAHSSLDQPTGES
ncbi:hypothetical protein IQ250_28040 [Pseudanabaenaceae cyanobacterium LEGE 13415]|nr:hypothetical protein [Pseudanabaenaceae cyanobacterium LEGE 13415]